MNTIQDLASQIAATARTGEVSSAEAERLRALAAQFEALLLGQMMREMRSSMFEDDDASGFGGGPLADSMYAELSLALGRAGGLGLADSMMTPLMRETQPEEPAGEDSLIPNGVVSSTFGWRRHPIDGTLKFHKGMDIALPEGHAVAAPRAGRVTFAGELAGYGKTVVVAHEGGISTRYAHLSEASVRVGDQVVAGQNIAKSGSTGRVSGAHLHFEVLENGQPVDPSRLDGAGPRRKYEP